METGLYFLLFCAVVGVNAASSILDYPFFAAVESRGKHLCSATVVDDFYVMTTISCVGATNSKNLTVRVGTEKMGYRGAVYKVINIHPSKQGDVAMLQLASALNFNPRVIPVHPNNNNIKEGQPGTLLTWDSGKSQISDLEAAPVIVLPTKNCSAAYSGLLNITSNMFCIVPSDDKSHPCLADIGAPLYYNEQYYGLVTQTADCSNPNLPVVVTAVAPFTSFLIATLCDFEINF